MVIPFFFFFPPSICGERLLRGDGLENLPLIWTCEDTPEEAALSAGDGARPPRQEEEPGCCLLSPSAKGRRRGLCSFGGTRRKKNDNYEYSTLYVRTH